MKKTIKIYYSFLLVLLIVLFEQGAFAQIPEPPVPDKPLNTVEVIAKSCGDSIILRWAPTSIDSWLGGNNYGYNISRYRVMDEKKKVIDYPQKELLVKAQRPLELSVIEKLYREDIYAAVVAQAIYGSSFDMDTRDEAVSFVNLATELSNRYSFAMFSCDMSSAASRSHGLIFTDKNIKYGEKYVYVIEPNWDDTLSVTDSALVFIAVNDTFSIPKPAQLYAHFQDKTVEVSWDVESMQLVFTAYNVERSDDGGKTYTQLNSKPLVNPVAGKDSKLRRMMYVDSISVYDKEYFYRVKGITPFGETGPPSEAVSGKGKEILVGVNPMIIKSEKLEGGKINVLWEFPENYENKIKGFIVERSHIADGIYEQISDTLNNTSRSFIDDEARNVNYYQVCAVSISDNLFCSFSSLIQLPDSVPPAIPSGLAGKIDSTGIVTLQWNANTESDFMSYSIYRSNHPEKEFVLINSEKIFNPVYTDTVPLNNLSGKVYYAVTAQDKNYNESVRCISVKIVKPDTIPPVAPVIRGYEVTGNGIVLDWVPSTSADVSKHTVYRKKADAREWQLIAVIDSTGSYGYYKDSLSEQGTVYNYLILSVDETGLESENSKPVTVKSGINRNAENIILQLKPGDNGKSIIIRWSGKNENIDKILIYKSVNGEKYALHRAIPVGEKQYTDTSVKLGNMYYYRSQTISKKGVRSKLSEPYTVKL